MTAKKSTKKSQEKSINELYGSGDVDSFMEAKNKISLSSYDANAKKKSKQISKAEKRKNTMNIDVSDEEVEERFNGDDDDYDTPLQDDNDMSDFESKEVTKRKKNKDADLNNKLSWGTEKRSFYTGKKVDEEKTYETDDEEFEEAEIKGLQEQRSSKIQEQDYDDQDDTFRSLVSNKFKSKDKSSTKSADEKLLHSVNKDLDSINFGNKTEEIEKLEKNISNYTKKEKLQYLLSESPLLLELLEEFKSKISEIKSSILPILEKVKSNNLQTSKGISFLETKYHLLLSYCLNITYFLMLKSSGASVKDHPVVDQLVRIRVILEKIKPLDHKLKYQIEKLLKTANSGVVSVNRDDPLNYKPNLSSMGNVDDEDDEDNVDDNGLDMDDEESLQARAGVYQAPRHYGSRGGFIDEEKSHSKQEKKARKTLERSVNSSMAKFIEEEYDDKPEEIDDYEDRTVIPGKTLRKGDNDKQSEIQNYEEANFTRIQLSKADKKKLKEQQRNKNRLDDGLDSLVDFNDLSGLVDKDSDKQSKEDQEYLKQKRMQTIQNISSKGDKKRKSQDIEDILDSNSNVKKYKQQNIRDEEIDSDNEGSDDDISSFREPEYNGQFKTKEQMEQDKLNNRYLNDSIQNGSKRKINKQIDKNRGELHRQRNKENSTPHLRNRNRYEKALKKRHNQIQNVERKDSSYTGTKSINTSTIKSQHYLN
ncbi:U3 snoRNP protein [Tieghemostelium lacteum]|uniref:U3 snoRNP protein n=1 Tax=Tieghemostelium lacteum TaxID=361077 RepID=A0A151ZS85_TIELA|nr:U3 snoRNP protein [Tieghemostelium lacteum]|eukprot:KYQ96795.1 U3 snoRNP protein [Tieghemostelium lacteum]